jgi:hypothetical protein
MHKLRTSYGEHYKPVIPLSASKLVHDSAACKHSRFPYTLVFCRSMHLSMHLPKEMVHAQPMTAFQQGKQVCCIPRR